MRNVMAVDWMFYKMCQWSYLAKIILSIFFSRYGFFSVYLISVASNVNRNKIMLYPEPSDICKIKP